MALDSDDTTIGSSEQSDSTVGLSRDSLCAVSSLPARYESTGVLGHGGMGIVIQAFDIIIERKVAIKLLMFEGAKRPEMQERFLREARVLSNLKHPNIVSIFSSDLTNGGEPYHVMELLDGKSLARELETGAMPTGVFLNVLKQVVSGLFHAHKNGVIHRDLKPGNIMLCGNIGQPLQVKIIDFGIARFEGSGGDRDVNTQSLTQTGCVLGSPIYMSPEQCAGNRADHLSDIYGLGCIMFECLAGKPPFRGESALQTMYMHMREPPPSLEALARNAGERRLGLLIDRCLMKRPQDRPQSMEEIQAELDSVALQPLSETVHFQTQLATMSYRNKSMVLLVICLAVAITVSFSKWYQSAQREQEALSGRIKREQQREKTRKGDEKMRDDLRIRVNDLEGRAASDSRSLKDFVESSIQLGQYSTKFEHFDEAYAIYKRVLGYCIADDEQTGVERMWLFVCMADCRRRQGKYELAEQELTNAKEIVDRHSPCKWHYWRSRINLDACEQKWSDLEIHVKQLPQVWDGATFSIIKNMVVKAQFDETIAPTFSDELKRVLELVKRTSVASQSDAITKDRIIKHIRHLQRSDTVSLIQN